MKAGDRKLSPSGGKRKIFRLFRTRSPLGSSNLPQKIEPMSNPAPQLVQKLWNYCNILSDDCLSYGDYVEQLTFLLFLKMAEEQSQPPFNKPSSVPKGYDWPS